MVNNDMKISKVSEMDVQNSRNLWVSRWKFLIVPKKNGNFQIFKNSNTSLWPAFSLDWPNFHQKWTIMGLKLAILDGKLTYFLF